MVSNEEIKRRLEAKRKGVKFEEDKKPVHKVEKHVPRVEKPVERGKPCPSCKTENPENAKFCVGCGEALKETSAAETSRMESITELSDNVPKEAETTAQSGDFKVCPNCNQKNPQEAKFCVVCGHKFEKEAPAKTADIKTPVALEEPGEEAVEEPAEEMKEVQEIPEEPVEEEPVETGEIAEEVLPAKEPETVPEEKVPETEEHSETEAAKSSEGIEVDPVERIKKAKELWDIGAITQEEFDKIKNKYLDEI